MGPSPCSTKHLHLETLPLWLNLNEQVSNCSMFELLFEFNTTALFLWDTMFLLFTWETILKVLNGIRIQSDTDSILYVTQILLTCVRFQFGNL